MPRVRKKTSLKLSYTQVTFLLVKFVLIKLGSLPLYLVSTIFSSLSLISVPKLLKHPVKYSTYKLHRHRGRPRTTPLIPFYKVKLAKFIRKYLPKPVRIGIVATVILLMLISYTSFIFIAAYELPNPERLVAPNQPITTEFFDRNGALLYRMYEGRNRTLIKLEDIPQSLLHATLAIEDKNFYAHMGVDPLAILRAAITNLQTGSQEGASTLTQQVIKNSLLTPEKTYTRKVKEIILSLWAERLYSKDEILQMYFNEAPLGGAFWGFEAASQGYFGKSVKDLTLAEAAFLAGLPASPTQFSPYGGTPELGKERQKQVLRRMVEDKYITQASADQAIAQELKIKPASNDIKAAHFVMYVKDYLSQKYGARVVSQGGLKIHTSLDLGLQEEVEKIVKDEIETLAHLNVRNGAAMVTDPKTGQILAMVGSRDYKFPGYGNFNVALALRQPGSSIKPITYATAFKLGFSPGNTVLDTPVNFKDEWGNSYAPVNYDGRFHGPVSIRTALGSSYNIPAVKMLATVGMEAMINQSRAMGITTFNSPQNYGLSLTLGGADVKLIDMMSVYGTFAQMGVKKVPTPILKVEDYNGNSLEEYQNQGEVVLSPQIAYLITSILADNKAREPAFGPNSLLKIEGHEVGVKTGTSDNKKDNWTFGYTPDFVVGVWVGNNDNSYLHPSLTSGVTGASPIWNKIMKGILAKHPNHGFKKPAGIVEVTVDGRKDLSVADNLPKSLVRTKTEKDEQSSTGYKTTFFDSFSAYATSSAQAREPQPSL